MNINPKEYANFEACKKQGFVSLTWEEGVDEITGLDRHYANVEGNCFVIDVYVDHIQPNTKSSQKKFKISVCFRYFFSDLGQVACKTFSQEEYTIESALDFAQWQATLILKLLNSKNTS